MLYLIKSDPEQVSNETILKLVDRRIKTPEEDIPDGIHGDEFINIQRDKPQIIQLHLNDINKYIGLIDAKLEQFRQKYVATIKRLTTMIEITEISALYILGEIGIDMSVWAVLS